MQAKQDESEVWEYLGKAFEVQHRLPPLLGGCLSSWQVQAVCSEKWWTRSAGRRAGSGGERASCLAADSAVIFRWTISRVSDDRSWSETQRRRSGLSLLLQPLRAGSYLKHPSATEAWLAPASHRTMTVSPDTSISCPSLLLFSTLLDSPPLHLRKLLPWLLKESHREEGCSCSIALGVLFLFHPHHCPLSPGVGSGV